MFHFKSTKNVGGTGNLLASIYIMFSSGATIAESAGSKIINLNALPDTALHFFSNSTKLQSFPVFLTYLVFLALIPLWRKILPLMHLKKPMLVYNVICVILSILSSWYLFYGSYVAGTVYGFVNNETLKLGFQLYTFSKNFELLDTVFMVLRHKWNQISFLHVFHHSSILILGNYALKYASFPPVALIIGLNSVVHIFLYAYYARTAFSTTNRPTWKKALTQFQIAQFVFDIGFSTLGYMRHGFCVYSIFYAVSMMVLFSNFYYVAYIKKKPETTKKIN